MSHSNTMALSDEELAVLDDFLLSGEGEEERLLIDEAHGCITAIVVGHKVAGDSQDWMSEVWGSPSFKDDDERALMTTLLQRLYDDIKTTLDQSQGFEPLVIEEEIEDIIIEVYEGWCFGFMTGVESQQEQWDQLPKNEQSYLAPIAKLALLHGDETADMDDDEYEMWVELLSGAVTALYQYWSAQNELTFDNGQ